MTTVALLALPQFFDNAGLPLAGGQLFTYAAGTLTPLATYTDRSGTIPNSNPVILDSSGRADIWLSVNVPYQLILKDSVGNTMDTVDSFYAGADPAQLTAAGIVPATGGTYTGLVSFTGGATFDGTPAQDLATLDSLGIASVQNANLWTNPDGAIWQRNVTPVADGNYGFDRIINLSDTGSTAIAQLAQPLDGVPFAIRGLQPDVAPKRFGFCQIVEARDCLAYRGKSMHFALKVRSSVTTNIRCALVAWVGAQDVVARDPVNNWASTNFTAGNFFIAGTIPIAVTATTATATVWTDVVASSSSPGGSLASSSMNNLYLMVWTDVPQAQNVTIDISTMRCGQGNVAQLWTPVNIATEVNKCLRYYFKLTGSAVAAPVATGTYYAGTSALAYFPFPSLMRVAPTISFINSGTWTGLSGGGVLNLGNASALGVTNAGAEINFATTAAATAGFGVVVRVGTVGNSLQADAEL